MWDTYTSGDNVTLKSFDKYWGTNGTINAFIVRFISETSQALERESVLANWLLLQKQVYAVSSDLRGYSLS